MAHLRLGVPIPNSKATPKRGSIYPQFVGTHQRDGVHIADLKRSTEVWESISPTQKATRKRGGSHSQIKEPHRSVCVRTLTSKGHLEVWEFVSPTRAAGPKSGSPYPQFQGPNRGMKARMPIWVATLKRGCPGPQLQAPHQRVGQSIAASKPKTRNMGGGILHSWGNGHAWESLLPTRGATSKNGSPYPQDHGPHRSMGVHMPHLMGHNEAWECTSPLQGPH